MKSRQKRWLNSYITSNTQNKMILLKTLINFYPIRYLVLIQSQSNEKDIRIVMNKKNWEVNILANRQVNIR